MVAGGDVRVGQIANPFWLPQSLNNRTYEATYFSTLGGADTVAISSLSGNVTLQGQATEVNSASNGSDAWLMDWYANILTNPVRPWLRAGITGTANLQPFQTVAAVMPGTIRATAFSGDIDLVGTLTLAPAAAGTLDLLAGGSINGLTINGVNDGAFEWRTAAIDLSDADPARLPSPTNPTSFATYADTRKTTPMTLLAPVDALFAASGRMDLSLAEKVALHAQLADPSGRLAPLHANDASPLRLYASAGDISGLTLYSGKAARVVASRDITDVALYVQNARSQDTTVVAAGRDVVAYDPASPQRLAAQQPGNVLSGLAGETNPASGTPTAGDIQLAGPGTLEVVAGRNLTLGSGSDARRDGTATGITSIGSVSNPALAQASGAEILASAGLESVYSTTSAAAHEAPGLATAGPNYAGFIARFLDPRTAGAEAGRYLPDLGALMGLTTTDTTKIWSAFGFASGQQLTERQAGWLFDIFQLVLRNAARDRNNPDSPGFGGYSTGFAAISALFPGSPLPTAADLSSTVPVVRPDGPWAGTISMVATSRCWCRVGALPWAARPIRKNRTREFSRNAAAIFRSTPPTA